LGWRPPPPRCGRRGRAGLRNCHTKRPGVPPRTTVPVVLAPQEEQPLTAPTALQEQAMRSFDLQRHYACPLRGCSAMARSLPLRETRGRNLNLPDVQGSYGLGVPTLEVEGTCGGGSGLNERRVPSRSVIDWRSPSPTKAPTRSVQYNVCTVTEVGGAPPSPRQGARIPQGRLRGAWRRGGSVEIVRPKRRGKAESCAKDLTKA
jgi:hypothetical protein